MLMMFIFKRRILKHIKLHSFLLIQGILPGINAVGLVVIKNQKDVQRRNNTTMENIIIHVRISAQFVDKKAIQDIVIVVQDLIQIQISSPLRLMEG